MRTSESLTVAVRPDPRVVRSEAAIRKALLERLAAGREFDSLTVSEIARQAGVTRKTFYARFGSLQQVAQRIVLDLCSDIAARIDDAMLSIPLKDDSLSMLVFAAYAEYQDVLAPLVRHCPAGLFIEPVSAIAAQVLDRVIWVNKAPPMEEAERAYLIATVASMVHGALSVWVKREFAEPAERVARFMDTLLASGMQKVVFPNRA